MSNSVNRSLYLVLVGLLVLAAIFVQRGMSTAKKSGAAVNRDEHIAFNRNTKQLVFSKHARCRMNCRHIDSSEVMEILREGTINYRKSDTLGPRDPKFALEGRTHDNQRVRIVFAAAPMKTVVVTVIDLDQDIQCDCP